MLRRYLQKGGKANQKLSHKNISRSIVKQKGKSTIEFLNYALDKLGSNNTLDVLHNFFCTHAVRSIDLIKVFLHQVDESFFFLHLK